ncbi:MAG: alpha/beta hydrolase [Candidatus Izimaplasma sp.]|nr:alpha/beta hydrolase [Candidatus Izimaplasma bacterium]
MLKTIIKKLLVVLIILFSVFLVVFVRFDIPTSKLEALYFTKHSNYIDLTISDLNDEPLSIQLHYQDLGETTDPVVVLIHGTFSSSHTFSVWAEKLVEEGYRVVIPDLPYYGLSSKFNDNITSYRRSSETIIALLNHLEVTEFHLAGNSLGGAVAWFLASEHPSRINTLTLIDAVYPNREVEETRREGLSKITQYNIVANPLSKLTPKFLVRKALESAYGNPNRLKDETLDRYYNLLRKSGTRKAIMTIQREPEPSFTYVERLESLSMPIFLMWGKQDSWIPIDTVSLFKETCDIPSSHIYIYSSLGHVPMEESPSVTVLDYIQIIKR